MFSHSRNVYSFIDDHGSQPPLHFTSNIALSPIKFSRFKVPKALPQLNTSKSKGPDGIPVLFLKSCAPELAPVLKRLSQLSYNLGIFPSSLKLAHIFPIPKKWENLTLQTIALLQSLFSCLRRWRPLSPNNSLPPFKLTTSFLIISMVFNKPDLPVTV